MAKSKKATKPKTATGRKTKTKKLTMKDMKKISGGFGIHLPFSIGPQRVRTPNPGVHVTPVSSRRSPSPSPSGGSGANRQKAGR